MNIKERLKTNINIKNISDLLFLIFFFNLYFVSLSLYFSNFNYIYLVGNIVIILLFLFKFLFSNKIKIISNIVIGILILIIFFILFNEYYLGFKIEMNSLFSISQSITSYKYEFYSINALLINQKHALFINNLINSLIFSYVIYNFYHLLKGYLILIINIPLIVLSIYFEVPFNSALVILMILLNVTFIILNIYFNSKGYEGSLKKVKLKNIGILLSFSLIFGGSIFLISSTYSSLSSVSNVSTSIRDYFNNPVNEKNNSNNKENSSSENTNENTNSSDDTKDEAGKTVSRIPILLIVLIIIFSIFLLIPIFLIIKDIIKNKKNRELLNSSDPKTLIKSNYLESIKILRKLGIKYQNKGYLEYVNDLKDFDENYKNLYINASNIYLKSSYSNNKITEDEIKLIKEFYKETSKELFKKSKGMKKIYWRVVRKYE